MEQVRWETREEAAEKGLRIARLNGVGGELTFEDPVALNNSQLTAACSIGYLTYVGSGSNITRAKIGRYCAISQNVNIGPSEHPIDWLSVHPFQYSGTRNFSGSPAYESISAKFPHNSIEADVVIGNDVWIGDGAFIRRGVSIGDGAVIGARAVVTKDVPDYAMVAGTPAKVIRYRFDEPICTKLKSLKWWEYDMSTVKGEIDFSDIEAAISTLEKAVASGLLTKITPATYVVKGGAPLIGRRIS